MNSITSKTIAESIVEYGTSKHMNLALIEMEGEQHISINGAVERARRLKIRTSGADDWWAVATYQQDDYDSPSFKTPVELFQWATRLLDGIFEKEAANE